MSTIRRRLDDLEAAAGRVAGRCPTCGADDARPRVLVSGEAAPARPEPTPADLAACPACGREPLYVVIDYERMRDLWREMTPADHEALKAHLGAVCESYRP